MGTEFTFHDFVDEGGKNVVHDWLGGLPLGVKVKINNRLLHLEALNRGQWQRPFVDTLDGHCAGLFEIRSSRQGVQYRLLGAHNEEQKPVLLHGFIKPDDRVDERECDEAFARNAQVEANPGKHRTEHNYE